MAVSTDTDEAGFIVEHGHPQEGSRLVDCEGFRRGVDVARIVVLTTADPQEAEKHICDWPDGNGLPYCGRPAVSWRFTEACEWLAVCVSHEAVVTVDSARERVRESNKYLVRAKTTEGETFSVLTDEDEIVAASRLAEQTAKMRDCRGFVFSVEVIDVEYELTTTKGAP